MQPAYPGDPFATIHPQPLPARIPPPVHPKETTLAQYPSTIPSKLNQRKIQELAAVSEYSLSTRTHAAGSDVIMSHVQQVESHPDTACIL